MQASSTTANSNVRQVPGWTPAQVEAHLVEAAWTMRRLPDKERAWLYGSTVMWPAFRSTASDAFGGPSMSALQQSLRTRPTPKQIDGYQPILDWLQMLPDTTDRRVIFWAAWHLNGLSRASEREPLPWGKVRQSLGVTNGERGYSRWSLKRRHSSGLQLIAGVLTNREEK